MHHCSFCPKSFQSPFLREYHEQRIHVGINTSYVKFKRYYLAYISDQDRDPEQNKCKKCKKLFFRQKTLNIHKKVCGLEISPKGVVDFQCPNCPKQFRFQFKLNRHQKSCPNRIPEKIFAYRTQRCSYCHEELDSVNPHVCPWDRMVYALEAQMTSEYFTVQDYLAISRSRELILSEIEKLKQISITIMNSLNQLPNSSDTAYINLQFQSYTLRDQVDTIENIIVSKFPDPDED